MAFMSSVRRRLYARFVTLPQFLLVVVLLTTFWLLLVCSRLRRVQAICAMTLMCVDVLSRELKLCQEEVDSVAFWRLC